ncbi:hypothetical protein GIY23_11260 [Allosaccharopolyspora coralli]|uniref:Uncharacterized protein n=1 Tax=Allosaccharopolyspora coralli TaxID=2665642 RepID=A0A5Q3Q6C7_9PSEU|nr:hypothetical protein [Allosaccharopolyspora coralli]QGK70022.1 hypothetical protein GIY23_11260 [Allosaccharopolyspora coralli]
MRKPADGPQVPLAPLNVDRVVEQWRADRPELPARNTVSVGVSERTPTSSVRWWHRLRWWRG